MSATCAPTAAQVSCSTSSHLQPRGALYYIALEAPFLCFSLAFLLQLAARFDLACVLMASKVETWSKRICSLTVFISLFGNAAVLFPKAHGGVLLRCDGFNIWGQMSDEDCFDVALTDLCLHAACSLGMLFFASSTEWLESKEQLAVRLLRILPTVVAKFIVSSMEFVLFLPFYPAVCFFSSVTLGYSCLSLGKNFAVFVVIGMATQVGLVTLIVCGAGVSTGGNSSADINCMPFVLLAAITIGAVGIVTFTVHLFFIALDGIENFEQFSISFSIAVITPEVCIALISQVPTLLQAFFVLANYRKGEEFYKLRAFTHHRLRDCTEHSFDHVLEILYAFADLDTLMTREEIKLHCAIRGASLPLPDGDGKNLISLLLHHECCRRVNLLLNFLALFAPFPSRCRHIRSPQLDDQSASTNEAMSWQTAANRLFWSMCSSLITITTDPTSREWWCLLPGVLWDAESIELLTDPKRFRCFTIFVVFPSREAALKHYNNEVPLLSVLICFCGRVDKLTEDVGFIKPNTQFEIVEPLRRGIVSFDDGAGGFKRCTLYTMKVDKQHRGDDIFGIEPPVSRVVILSPPPPNVCNDDASDVSL